MVAAPNTAGAQIITFPIGFNSLYTIITTLDTIEPPGLSGQTTSKNFPINFSRSICESTNTTFTIGYTYATKTGETPYTRYIALGECI